MNAQDGPGGDVYTPGAGLPLAVPVGRSDQGVSAQVRDEFARTREPNTPSVSLSVDHSSADRSSLPVRLGVRQLARLVDQLSERDHAVLRLVGEHRYLTTYQLQHFCFLDHQSEATGARVTRRVVRRLQQAGLLRALSRRVGGVRAGSSATIWQLAPAGVRVVYGHGKRRRTSEPSERFLQHSLAVADVHVQLHQHRRIEAIEQVDVEVEPASWRTYQGPGGQRRWLQPDLYAEITSSDFLDRHFIEVDLGTESLPTLLNKCHQYEDYRRTGIEQDRHGSFPLVVWLFLDPARAERLEQAIRRTRRLTEAMYRFTTPGTLTQVLAGGAP